MTGKEYADLIASYLVATFGDRGIKVFREVEIGKSIIGKNRRIDILVICDGKDLGYAIECKFQDQQGTVDEKIPYALDDMRAMHLAGCIAYAGEGFSEGVRHLLRASNVAAYCLPVAGSLKSSDQTRELDHQLAVHFRWWDVLVRSKEPFGG
jgi:hypothetical protein